MIDVSRFRPRIISVLEEVPFLAPFIFRLSIRKL
jgi:hypothetical protein